MLDLVVNLKLTVNGIEKIASIVFPVTGAWTNWSNYTTTQPLEAGNNTITLIATGTSGGNFDELVIGGTTGINDMTTAKNISIYPNPYKQGKLKIDFSGLSDKAKVSIKNMLGQTVYQETVFTNSSAEINFSEKMTKAVYLIVVESGDKKMIKKLIVE